MKKYIKSCDVILLIIVFLLSGTKDLTAQVRELRIGDAIPRDVVSSVINFATPTINIAELDYKLIILDYWATTCSPCIAAFPKYDKLQKQFGDSILLMPVVTTEKNVIEKFWKENKITRTVNLPSIVGDKVLTKYFPHMGVPYEIWIKDGKVFALTGAEYVNEKEIRAVLRGESRNWEVYNKVKYNYDSSLIPIASTENSLIKNYIPRVRPRIIFRESTAELKSSVLRIINLPLVELYWEALRETADFRDYSNRMVIAVKDPARLIKPKDAYQAEWSSQNSYCYEAYLPGKVSKEALLRKMKSDLDRKFLLNGRIEKIKLNCWVLIKAGNSQPPFKKISTSIAFREFEADSWRDLSEKMNMIVEGSFITTDNVNDKPFSQPVNIEVPESGSVDEYRIALRKAGFDIRQEVRNISSFVISDK